MFMQMFAFIRRAVYTASPGLLAGVAALWLVASDRPRSPENDRRMVRVEIPAPPYQPDMLTDTIPVRLHCEMTDFPGGQRSVIIVREGTNPDRTP